MACDWARHSTGITSKPRAVVVSGSTSGHRLARTVGPTCRQDCDIVNVDFYFERKSENSGMRHCKCRLLFLREKVKIHRLLLPFRADSGFFGVIVTLEIEPGRVYGGQR